MLKHRWTDRICCIVLALSLLLTVTLTGIAGAADGAGRTMGYENRLFDQSRVHEIEIVMDDWESFLETCTNEEYALCTVIIDGEVYNNVAIRAKGNTSLSSVRSYGNNRYSFKIEFDHYNNGGSYHGLDKLSLNNVIQDNTYMKDYLAYTLMNEMGVAAPLCSYANISVNGETWGLYLAVEAVEDSFLQRNYGSDYGELYKPDSMSFGGGRGNGMDFNMDDFATMFEGEGNTFPQMPEGGMSFPGGMSFGNGEEMPEGGMSFPGGMSFGSGEETPEGGMSFPGGMSFGSGEEMPEGGTSFPGGMSFGNGDAMPEGGMSFPGGMSFGSGEGTQSAEASTDKAPEQTDDQPAQSGDVSSQNRMQFGGGMGNFGGMGGFGGMGSSDVKLQYTDDNPDSYSNIFTNAKTDITEADQSRLIAALKSLGEGDTAAVDTDAVIRYLVVHSFMCNDDSYTGVMVHNYYLHEDNGVLSMIPWDYNLSMGGFSMGMGSGGTSTVNSPIDSPVSGDVSDRPMVAWIFSDEAYLQEYHDVYAEFIAEIFESGWLEQKIDDTIALISSYVESDPTAFCSYEEFQNGAQTLREFCLLRCESISGQLDGSIPSTSEGQSSASGSLIDASHLTLSEMGGMGKGGMDFGFGSEQNFRPGSKTADGTAASAQSKTTRQALETEKTAVDAPAMQPTPNSSSAQSSLSPVLISSLAVLLLAIVILWFTKGRA